MSGAAARTGVESFKKRKRSINNKRRRGLYKNPTKSNQQTAIEIIGARTENLRYIKNTDNVSILIEVFIIWSD